MQVIYIILEALHYSMGTRQKEFVDKDREARSEFYEILDGEPASKKSMIKKMRRLIDTDPDFLDPYLLIHEILLGRRDIEEADALLDNAYSRAIKLITNKKGEWPDRLEWGFLENRHIIRTLVGKGCFLWEKSENDAALELFRKLLKTNLGDNCGVRYIILAIKMNISSKKFERRFEKGGYYDHRVGDWFDENYEKFPDEFGWWEKELEAMEKS
jgi:tetratricopeptide (TPR) repeat protein